MDLLIKTKKTGKGLVTAETGTHAGGRNPKDQWYVIQISENCKHARLCSSQDVLISPDYPCFYASCS